MHFSTIVSAFALAGTALAGINTTREYELRTLLKPGQEGKERFNDLWLVASHTGAGLNDGVFYSNRSYAAKGFENATNITQSDGQPFFNQLFDLGGTLPYDLYVQDVNFYAAWEPVRIDGGSGTGGFYMNSSGLQWNSAPSGPAAVCQVEVTTMTTRTPRAVLISTLFLSISRCWVIPESDDCIHGVKSVDVQDRYRPSSERIHQEQLITLRSTNRQPRT
ncbi:hypothetical protein KCU81_g94, partial [Aureobasidium melanogenum]